MKVITSPEMEKMYADRQIFKKAIQPEDIAAAVAFLASDDAKMITGQILAVNAGQFLH
jgi:NAD(P)-dependent dehydrogenase (short-subunit alcohol dehydrogenase family)